MVFQKFIMKSKLEKKEQETPGFHENTTSVPVKLDNTRTAGAGDRVILKIMLKVYYCK